MAWITAGLGPTRRCAPRNRLGRRPAALGRSRGSRPPGGRVIPFPGHGSIIVIAVGQQRRHFAQLLCRLLEQFDLLAQLRVLRLLAPQYLVNILHATPYSGIYKGYGLGSTTDALQKITWVTPLSWEYG